MIKKCILLSLMLAAPALAEVPQVTVTARAETTGVTGDADDPAIWVNPADPLKSLVLGTDKDNGLHVYDLDGKDVAFFPDGSINNVDLREFRLNGETVWLAAGTERDRDELVLYVIRADGSVSRATPHRFAGIPEAGKKIAKIYGLAMSRDPATGRVWVLANFKTGHIAQYEVLDAGGGTVTLQQARILKVGSQPEGMVSDDRTGSLYVGEEDVAIWRFPAFPEGGDVAAQVAGIPSDCFPRDDIEGLAVYDGAAGRYLLASSQGIHRVGVLSLEDPEKPVCAGLVEIGAGTVDGVSETDGLDVVAAPLGPDYPEGMLVMMDDQNADFTTNFKFISFVDIKRALGLR